MSTSQFNRTRRRKLRKIRDAERRRMRHLEGDWKFRGWRPRPNAERYDIKTKERK